MGTRARPTRPALRARHTVTGHVKVDGTDSGATHLGDRDKWGPIVRGRVRVIHHHAVVRRQRILDYPPLPCIAVAGVWPAPSVIAREPL
jgi:hypothetical protein